MPFFSDEIRNYRPGPQFAKLASFHPAAVAALQHTFGQSGPHMPFQAPQVGAGKVLDPNVPQVGVGRRVYPRVIR